MLKKWKQVSTKILYEHPRLTLIEDEVELPDGSITTYLKTSTKSHAAITVIAIKGGKVLLSQEYAYPPNEILYQFPGGQSICAKI